MDELFDKGLVDKGIDEDETDDAFVRNRRRRARRVIVTGGAVVAIVGVGLAIVRPWDGSEHAGGASKPTGGVVRPVAGDQPEPDLANRLVLGSLPDGYTLQWVNDGETKLAGDQFDPPLATNVVLAADGASLSTGPWLMATVQLLDKFERKSFDPSGYVSTGNGQPVRVADLAGATAVDDFNDTVELVFGPVNAGYVVSLTAKGMLQGELVAIAEEMSFDESSNEAVAWPLFGDGVDRLAMKPISSYAQPSFGFSGGVASAMILGGSANSTSISYGTPRGDCVSVTNQQVPAGLEVMALARFSLTGVSDVSVHGLPAVMGGVDQLFGGVVVVWEEGGRLVAVVTTAGVDDALARAESVKVIDEVAWADLIQEATNNVGGSDGQPTESWLIAAGEFDDSATWVIEGSVDDRGKFTACTNTFSVNSSSSGCGSASEVAVPSVVTIGGVGGDGVRGVGFVGFVDDAVAGVVLRFTATDGTIAEAPLRTVRPDWAFQAAGVVAVQGGVVELVAADGSVLVSQAVDQGDLDAVGSGSNVTSATTAPAAPAG